MSIQTRKIKNQSLASALEIQYIQYEHAWSQERLYT